MAKKKPIGFGEGKAQRAERFELFCLEYTKDQNAARAARAVGYSEKTAREQGCYLLTKPIIQQRIKQIIDERKARTLLEGDEILLEIKKIATSDVRRLFDLKTGAMLPMDQWPDEVAACVASIEVDEIFAGRGENRALIGYTKKVKLWDKPKSQENLGRNKGLFKDVVDNQGQVTVVAANEAEVKATREKIKNDC